MEERFKKIEEEANRTEAKRWCGRFGRPGNAEELGREVEERASGGWGRTAKRERGRRARGSGADRRGPLGSEGERGRGHWAEGRRENGPETRLAAQQGKRAFFF